MLYLVQRDGSHCRYCKADVKPLEIHHVDGNPANNVKDNLILLCHSCHVKISMAQAKERGIKVERGGERKDPTVELKNLVNYNDGSPEMQVNEYAELAYRNWLTAAIENSPDRMVSKKQAIYSGAEVTGSSVNACRGYYGKMVSDEGGLTEGKIGGKGTTFVRFKEGRD